MMSNGGIGDGVSAAVARAMGAGRVQDAGALVTHAAVPGWTADLLGAALRGAGNVRAPALVARLL